MNSKHQITTHCGFIAIIGRPNVGKSTLLNKIVAKKISITSKKPQTTRHKILGIKTIDNYQFIYVDTPGLHSATKKTINKLMNKVAIDAIRDVDVIIFMVEGLMWHQEDLLVLEKIQQAKSKAPVILAINKVDKIPDKDLLLPHINALQQKIKCVEIIPISAEKNTNIIALEDIVKKFLPENPFFFPVEQLTDKDERFLVAEILREKLVRFLGEELPYATSVVIESFKLENEIIHIAASIFVEREGQKAIVIGKNGITLKKIGSLARKDMEILLGKKVFLQTWVKLKNNWSEDKNFLQQVGFDT